MFRSRNRSQEPGENQMKLDFSKTLASAASAGLMLGALRCGGGRIGGGRLGRRCQPRASLLQDRTVLRQGLRGRGQATCAGKNACKHQGGCNALSQ
jgi:hypothetical protein